MTYPNPVAAGLARGLKPAGVDDDNIALHDLMLIGIDAKLGRLEKLQERVADAAVRAVVAAEAQASALETLTALFASCVGTSYASCPDLATPNVNYFRASSDGKPFRCDQTEDDSHAD